jgi:uncharacterized protein
MRLLAFLALSFVAILSDSASAVTMTPINCRRPLHSATEQAICARGELIALDVQLAALLTYWVDHANYARQQEILYDQINWLSSRDSCGWDVNCIENAYYSRIQAVQKALAGG